MGLRIFNKTELKVRVKIWQLKALKVFNSLRLFIVVTAEILIEILAEIAVEVLVKVKVINADRKNLYIINI